MYVDDEIQKIEKDISLNKRKKLQKKYNVILIMMFICIVAYCTTEKLFGQDMIRFFPDTWTCPNPTCRYENYDGITHCALCGTPRKTRGYIKLGK